MPVDTLILAVDDEPALLKLIKLELTSKGHHVITTTRGKEALSLIERKRPDVVILDLLMPDMDGFEVLKQIKERNNIPVLLLTGRERDEDKVLGLDSGADDYLVKPFNPDELSARIGVLIRRTARSANSLTVVRIGEVEIDLEKREAKRKGQPVPLSRTEWNVLQYLVVHPGQVVASKELLTNVWGAEYVSDIQYLRVWVGRLRAKLESDPTHPEILKTVLGLGYMFDPDGLLPTVVNQELTQAN